MLGRIIWSLLFVYLSVTIGLKWIESRRLSGSMEIEGLLLSILLTHAVVRLTGGIHSPMILFYAVTVLFFAFYIGLFKNMLAVTGIFFLEASHYYLFPSSDGLPNEAIFFPLLLVLIPLIVRGYLKSLNREKEALQGTFNRIKSSVASLESPPEIHEKVQLTRLSEEKKQDEAIAMADKMESDLENILRLMLSSRPQIHRVVLLFYNHREEYLWVRAMVGREEALGVDPKKVVRLGEGMLGWVAKERRTVSIADFQSQKGKLDYDDGSAPVRSLLVVPFFEGERFEGLICADSREDHAFSDQDEELIQLAAKEILRALQYYREQQKMGEQTRVYSALLEISKNLGSRLDLAHRLETTIDSAKLIVAYDACFIFLVEPGERRMTVKAVRGYDPEVIDYNFPLTNGLLSIIVKNRQVLLFSEALKPKGARIFSPQQNRIFPDSCKIHVPAAASFLGLPMVIEDRVIGVVLFASNNENAFSTYDRHVLSIMCNHVAAFIAEAQAHAQIEKLAVTDGLTGIYNHRRFQERLMEEFVRVGRHPEPFSLLLIDIDYFKKINDTFGHPAGDAVIKMVAKTLVTLVRKADIVARYGGEEFVVLLVKSDAAQAFKMAERIRKAIETTPVRWQGKEMSATVSIGIAAQPEDSTNRDDLIAYADRALYGSKQGGRNRTTLYKDLTQDQYEVG